MVKTDSLITVRCSSPSSSSHTFDARNHAIVMGMGPIAASLHWKSFSDMTFRNVPLAKKLTIGFGAVLTVVAFSSLFVVVRTRHLVTIERLNSISIDVVDRVDRIKGDLMEARANVRKFVLTGDVADKAKTQTAVANLTREIASTKVILASD